MSIIPQEKLRTSANVMVTSSLFFEEKKDERYAFFTYSDTPRRGLVPFKALYLEYAVDDPTEYTFAQEVFGSWDHWLKIQKNKNVLAFIERCREERDIAIESRAIKQIMDEAESGKNSFQAAKFLATKGYTQFTDKTKKRTAKKHTESQAEVDLKRILGG